MAGMLVMSLGPARPFLLHDSSIGLLVWEHFIHGGTFQHLSAPLVNDLSRDAEYMIAWWSPGQYLLAGPIAWLGFNYGQAVSLAVFLACVLAGWGWYRLARQVGLGASAGAVMAAAQVLSYHTLYGYGAFIGGEVAVQASLPWFLRLAWALRASLRAQLLIMPVILCAGAFLKHSLMIPLLGIAVFWWWEQGIRKAWAVRPMAVYLLFLGSAVLLGYGFWNWAFLSRGATPLSTGNTFTVAGALGFPLIGPWLASTGLGAVGGRLAFQQGIHVADFWMQWSGAMIGAGLVANALLAWLLARHPTPGFARLVGSVVAMNVGVFAVLYFRGSAIDMVDRYFYAAGAMLMAAACAALPGLAGRARLLCGTGVGLCMLAGTGMAMVRTWSMWNAMPVGTTGYAQQQVSAEVLRRLHELDAAEGDSLFVIPEPEVALEIRWHRRWLLALDETARSTERYQGHGPRLVVLERRSASVPDGSVPGWAGRFADYDAAAWRREILGEWQIWRHDSPEPR